MISVLYVDDEPAVLDSCKKYLEHTGSFAVTTALSGKEALEKIRTSSFDAVISDYQMADINGLDLLKIIRNQLPDMPFIIFTGKGREEVVIDAFEHGVDFYVQKGGNPRVQYTDLMHKIERAVEDHRTKERLERSEEKFLNFVRNFDGIAFQINATGRFFLLEGTVEEISGYGRDDFLSGTVTLNTIVHADDKVRFLDEIRHLSTVPNARSDSVFRIVRKDGHIRWLHGILHNICMKNNDILHIQGALYDITYLTSAQEELVRTEAKWRAIITKAPVIISVINRAGQILFINKSRPPHKPSSLTGKRAADYLAPAEADMMEQALQRVFASGEIIRFESAVPMGESNTEWLSHQLSPITWNGSDDAVLIVSTIITERKWLEQNLRSSEEQYRAIIAALGDGIVILDPEGKITFASPRAYDIFEVPRDEQIIGKNAMDYIDPSFHQIGQWRMNNVLSGDIDAEPFEYLLVSREGSKFRGELVTTPLRDSSGNISSLLVLVRDIRRRKKLLPSDQP